MPEGAFAPNVLCCGVFQTTCNFGNSAVIAACYLGPSGMWGTPRGREGEIQEHWVPLSKPLYLQSLFEQQLSIVPSGPKGVS